MNEYREQRAAKTKKLIEEKGHPLYQFAKENELIKKLLENATNPDKNVLESLRAISIHYAKKGDLLYPLLKVGYGIAGPSDLMWTDDDEIRDELGRLAKAEKIDENWIAKFKEVVLEAKKMTLKEDVALFPNCAFNFTEEEWIGIYKDAKDYEEISGAESESWDVAEEKIKNVESALTKDEVVMAGGHMSLEQLTALLNTIPMEITFVDADNINRFFNEGPKDFKRPGMAIDREVFSCHPPKVEEQVRKIIGEFRAGTLDEIPIWMDKNGKCVLVKYMAVRDKDGKYLGTVELVQNMDFAKEYFQPKEKRIAKEY